MVAAAGAGGWLLVPTEATEPWKPSRAVTERIAADEDKAATRPTVALFVGDSYTAGAADVPRSDAFASLTCDSMSWLCLFDAQGGTGYAAEGHENLPTNTAFGQRLSRSKAEFRPDIVIVSGGRNDRGDPRAAAAASVYLRSVRQAFPGARLVVLSPFWVHSNPPAWMRTLRISVKSAATSAGAVWVDTDGWLRPADISGDGVHPTAAGHGALRNHLVTALQGLGFVPGQSAT